MNQIGHLIRQAIAEKGWTNSQLAQETGLLENNISHILGPKGNPQWITVDRMLRAIGYEVILKKKEPF